jgi:hypothetical protein
MPSEPTVSVESGADYLEIVMGGCGASPYPAMARIFPPTPETKSLLVLFFRKEHALLF